MTSSDRKTDALLATGELIVLLATLLGGTASNLLPSHLPATVQAHAKQSLIGTMVATLLISVVLILVQPRTTKDAINRRRQLVIRCLRIPRGVAVAAGGVLGNLVVAGSVGIAAGRGTACPSLLQRDSRERPHGRQAKGAVYGPEHPVSQNVRRVHRIMGWQAEELPANGLRHQSVEPSGNPQGRVDRPGGHHESIQAAVRTDGHLHGRLGEGGFVDIVIGSDQVWPLGPGLSAVHAAYDRCFVRGARHWC